MKPCDNCSAQFHPVAGTQLYCRSCRGSVRENRARLSAQKEAEPCVDCGKRWPACVMQYDHLPGVIKVDGVSRMMHRAWCVIAAEVAKCELVCANCHLIRTFSRGFGKRTSVAAVRPVRSPRPQAQTLTPAFHGQRVAPRHRTPPPLDYVSLEQRRKLARHG